DPYDGNTRIKEFKMLVQALHDRGIAVVMDVVYNHTFVLEGSSLNLTTPNYYYRKSSAENYYNGSGLGNTLSSDKAMTSKFISDSLCHWVNEYHIDGFRFDLMGCHDYPNLATWRANLDKIDQRVLMYGEPWAGGDAGISNGATKANIKNLTRVGAFNEGYSDALKGNHELNTSAQKGFLQGQSDTEIRKAGAGQASDLAGAKVNQLINYTDNHDNLTLFDKILASTGASGYRTGKDGKVTNSTASLLTTNKTAVNSPSAAVLGQMKLALTSALTSQGIPFTVAGTEFCRTKYGDANSYRSEDAINAIDWNRAATYSEVANYYAGLVAIRKAFNAFTNTTSVSTTSVSGCTAWQISNSASGQWSKIIVALNNTSAAKSISCSGNWTVVANGTKAGTTSLGTASGSYSVPAYSGVVLVDSASFGNYKQPNPGTATVITEHYTRDSATGSYTKTKTETAKYKEGQTWRASKSLAILFDHNFDKVESTASGNATYGAVTAGSTTTVKFYYTRNIKSGYLTVNFFNTSGGARIKTPMKYRMRQGDAYSIPATNVMGYELDTTRYPAMTRGTFDADHPATFNFYYKKLTNNTTRVHYYIADTKFKSVTGTILCYAYDDDGNEPLGDWPSQTKGTAGLKNDDSMGSGWKYIDVPATSCYVMFHYNDMQVPGQGEKGYTVSGEAWIKSGIVSFNNKIVTSHIDLKTGKQVSADVSKQYTNVSSNQTYITTPVTTLGKKYYVPANATGFYESGVTNVVYLYEEQQQQPTQPPTQPPTKPVDNPTTPIGSGKLMGDADGDDEVTVLDATRIQRVLASLEQKNADYDIVGDVDQDGEVTILDATAIQRYKAGLSIGEQCKINVRVQGGADPTTSAPTTPVEQPTDPPAGKHTYSEFVAMFTALNDELAKYPASTYGSNPYYLAAYNAIMEYQSLVADPFASADKFDTAYDACSAAKDGLANISGGTDPTTHGDDPSGTTTIYFTNNKRWSNINAYVWGVSGEGTWPGESLSPIATNTFGEDIYEITLSLGDSVIFNGDEGQTTDIAVSSLTQNAVYCTDDIDDDGHYYYGEWTYTPGGDQPITGGGKMYMVPSTEWKSDGARFAAYFFGGGDPVWYNMKYAGDNLYSVDIPDGYTNIIFCRMNGATTENNWDNKWNQTDDLTIEDGGTYTVNGWEK
ncbi:MAG: starch-binding protein, partial [Ruminococcus sp.]|nr:starch-binding protein [Ruminococcus sp.]